MVMIEKAANNDRQIGEHETKFVLPNSRALIVRSWLAKRCLPDPEYAEGRISSIYFDSKDFMMLDEKLNSYYLKTKVRLRWYSSLAENKLFPALFLEVKRKIGSARKKLRVKMSFGSDWVASRPLHDPDYLDVNRLIREQGIGIDQIIYPVFQLNYRRSRYVDTMTGARLSVDSDIHITRINRQMVHRIDERMLPYAVFEFKEKTGILPDWLVQVNALGECKKGAFSKYSECYSQLQQIIY